MRNAQKPDHVSLVTLVGRMREGRYVIPDFQREFEWMPWDIRELIRSIFLDYYIGSLLLWRGKPETFQALSCEPLHGYQGQKEDPEHIVLDGQQRLTALYYAFLAPDIAAPGRSNRFVFFIRVDQFAQENYDEAFEYDWRPRGLRLLRDQEAQFDGHMFPLAVVGSSGWALAGWVQGYERHWSEREQAAHSAGNEDDARQAARYVDNGRIFGRHLKDITEQYQISYIELDRDLELDKVCDIFTQINSRGVRLDVFDLINALMTPKGLQLKHLWRDAKPRLEFVDSEKLNVYILQVMSIRIQGYCSPKYLYYLMPGQAKKVRNDDGSLREETLVADTAAFERRWHEAVDALSRAIETLRHPQEFGAIKSSFLPYVSILPVFAALLAAARDWPAARRLDARKKIRHWYWASVFTNRYSGSVESTAARDYLSVTAWFEDDSTEPGFMRAFREQLPNLNLRRELRRGVSVYNGVFNLLVLRGARDWMTGDVPHYSDLDDHHIVPKSWGQENGLHREIDTILNRTPLSSETNRHVIHKRLPNAYLPELVRQNGEAVVRATLETHFVSREAFDILVRDPFTPADFEAFLVERQRTLLAAIEDFLLEQRVEVSPRLRELDERIEAVEIALRAVVAAALEDDPGQLPVAIRQEVEQRIERHLRRNALARPSAYSRLLGFLEHADLRELQSTIGNKLLWGRFQSLFSNKESLNLKFAQLADLRNSIRHSRSIDDVTRKEGEAAILWFEQLLTPRRAVAKAADGEV